MIVMTPDEEEQYCDVCEKELEDENDIYHGRHLECEPRSFDV